MVFTTSQLDQLTQELDTSRVSKRKGSGKDFKTGEPIMLSYLEGYDVIDHLNKIVGYGNWSFEQVAPPQIVDGVIVYFGRLVIVDTQHLSRVVREDVGAGPIVGSGKDGIENAFKTAATDALKRCARTLGAQFGNTLYDKDSPDHEPVKATKKAEAKQATVKAPTKKADFNTPPSPAKTSPAPKTGGKKYVDPAQIPSPNDGDGYKCEICGSAVHASKTYTAGELAHFYQDKTTGQLRCLACKTGKHA